MSPQNPSPFANKDIVEKQPIPVIIQTLRNVIDGEIYVHSKIRLLDELNRTTGFIAVTNATIYGLSANKSLYTKFTTVNLDHIVNIIPKQEIVYQEQQKGNSLP